MSVGAICFTSSGSNVGCWVVLVFPRSFPPLFGKKGFFSPYAIYAKKIGYATYTKKKFPSKRKKRLTLISTIELRFPREVLYEGPQLRKELVKPNAGVAAKGDRKRSKPRCKKNLELDPPPCPQERVANHQQKEAQETKKSQPEGCVQRSMCT